MNITKYGLLLFFLFVIITTSIFGSLAGYTVNGVPTVPTLTQGSSTITSMVPVLWASVTFMFHMVTFSIDGMPAFISAIFLVMSLITVFILAEVLIALLQAIGTWVP